MYNFKKLKELRRKATTDEKMNGSFVRDVGVQPKDPQTAIQEVNFGDKKKVDYYKAMGKKPMVPNKVKKPGCESVDHSLQELSKYKLAQYQMKAAPDLASRSMDQGSGFRDGEPLDDKSKATNRKKIVNRSAGIGRAAYKLTQKTNEEKQKPFRSLIGPEGPGMKRLRAKQDAIPMTDKSGRISRSRMQKKFGRFINTEETLDELEQKTYMSYLSKSRGRVKGKPSVAKSRGHAIKKTPEIHKRLFGDKEYEKHIKKMSEDGHADVASALRKCKTIMEDASDIHTKLAMMGTMDSLPSWWTNKLAVAAAYMDSMRDYLLYPTNEEVKDEKYLKKLKQTKDQATLGDMSTGIQKGGFQGRGMYEAKKVKTMKKVARDKLIGKKDPFEPEPSITTQVIRTDSPDNVVK